MSDEILEAVRPLLEGIAERAAEADRSGRIPTESVRELQEAGVFRMLQPTTFGGLERTPNEFYAVVRAISESCCSTGWVTSVVGVHPWQLALFDPRAQQEVWGDDPDVLLSSSYAPIGRLRPVDDGYQLSGHWSFSSGVHHAGWVLVGAMVLSAEDTPVDFMTALVPRRDFRVEEVWDSVGLRGTASDDVVVDDVFVPEHRLLRNYDQTQLRGPGQEINDGPLYRVPFGAVFTHAITAPLLGGALGCYRTYVGRMRSRIRLSLGGGSFAESPYAQVAVGRAASEIDAGILQTDRNMRQLLEHAEAGERPPMELRLRTRRDQVRATERAVQAVDLLFETAGGTSLKRGTTIERSWRDVHAGSMHVANEVERTLAMFGRGAFGLDVEDTLL
jgi:3-hydroxy-9,10-secoandrosta-1,3,5(10)-triene-9,17-dione monooxygenase